MRMRMMRREKKTKTEMRRMTRTERIIPTTWTSMAQSPVVGLRRKLERNLYVHGIHRVQETISFTTHSSVQNLRYL
jgi:hypothetical protein